MLASHSSRVLSRRLFQQTCTRGLASEYKPTLVNRREGEIGLGGRGSDAGLKVAVFGASGFLGPYVCNELGTLHISTLAGIVCSTIYWMWSCLYLLDIGKLLDP